MKRKRVEAGRYMVTDDQVGSFLVVQEDKRNFEEYGCPRRWFIEFEPDTLGETMVAGGFRTKRAAMKYLEDEIKLREWWCRKCEERKGNSELKFGLCMKCSAPI
jgi:hypothetical protein